jgi:undecaprenyl-diphosphatase
MLFRYRMNANVKTIDARVGRLLIVLSIVIGLSLVSMLTVWLYPDLIWLDKWMEVKINSCNTPWFDRFWFQFTSRWTWVPLMVVTLYSLFRACKGSVKRKLVFVLVSLLVVVLLDQLSSGVIKPLVQRLRPSHDPSICYLLHFVDGYRGGRYGFVSGHATNIVGIATWLCLLFRQQWLRIACLVFAVALCYSRLYLGVHFPGDVLCGALLGNVIALLSFHWVGSRFEIDHSYRPLGFVVVMIVTTLVVAVIATV